MSKIRLLIVGLDAATFDLIKPWIGEGKLPHLAQLMKDGASAQWYYNAALLGAS